MRKDLNKKLATAALAGLMSVGMFAATASATEPAGEANGCKDKAAQDSSSCKEKSACKEHGNCKEKGSCKDPASCKEKAE